MSSLVKILIALAALAFVGAVVVAFTGPIAEVTAEGLSRATNNLALIGIAMVVAGKKSEGA